MAIEKPEPLATNCGMRSDEGTVEQQLASLEAGELDLTAFPHAEHVRLAFHILERHPFGEAVTRFSRGLLTAKIGKPEVYHQTVTVAFLAVIGERRARASCADWEEFIATNPDLLDKDCMSRWYAPEQLASEIARRTFVLPQRRAAELS